MAATSASESTCSRERSGTARFVPTIGLSRRAPLCIRQVNRADKAEARTNAALTLGAVVERCRDRHAALRLKPKTLADVKRYLRHHWRPLHPLPRHKVER